MLSVSVDARPLDIENLRSQGIGRYAHGLLGPLVELAPRRGGELTLLRRRGAGASPFGEVGGRSRHLRRPPLPARAVELAEQAVLPLDLARLGSAVHHSLSLYRTPLVSRAASVVTMHDVAPLQWPDRYLRTGIAHRTLYRAVRRATAVICPSRAAARDVAAHLALDPERVTVIPEAAGAHFQRADATELRGRLGLDGTYLLYVGGLVNHDPRKDVAGLIEAFGGWQRAEGRAETLVLAGSGGPATRELEALADRVGARVEFTGFVPEADLPALISGAACLVSASRYEGFGLPALEAIACGTPVAAYDAGAVPETAGPGALLAPPGDGAALMRAAARICDEPELAQRLSAEGRRHAAAFSWARTAELTWDVYERAATLPRP